MMNAPNIETVLEDAKRHEEQRMNAVRELATHRQNLASVNEEAQRRRAALEEEIKQLTADAVKADTDAWNSALKAGWTETELRKIGFQKPGTRRRRRKTTRTRTAQQETQQEGDTSTSGDAEQS